MPSINDQSQFTKIFHLEHDFFRLNATYVDNNYIIMQKMLRSFPLILELFLLICTTNSASVNSTYGYNRFIVARQHQVAFSVYYYGGNTSTYTSHFTHTIQQPSNVYYSTQSLGSDIMSDNYSYNYCFLFYSISLNNVNTTTLNTYISGLFQLKYFNFFTFRYLLVMPSNPWINDYLTINTFLFTHLNNNQDSRILPAKYSPGNNILTSVMIRDIRMKFYKPNMPSIPQFFYINWEFSRNDTNYTLRFQISPYVDFYYIRYLVIMFDQTMLLQDFPQYRFAAVIWTLKSSASTQFLWSIYHTPIMFGISKIALQLGPDPSISFQLVKDTSNTWKVNIYYYGSILSNLDFRYSFAAFPYYVCDQYNYPYHNGSDNDCYDQCPTYQFMNTSRQCAGCRFDCLTCYDQNRCSSCNTTNRYLQNSNFSCVPIDGYYESYAKTPSLCNPICATCYGTDTFCTSCSNNNSVYFVNNSCVSCSTLLEGCNTCNSTYCFSCISPYRLIHPLLCNLPCNDSNCQTCLKNDPFFCITCKTQYFVPNAGGLCVATCGDGYLQNSQFCDDGNDISRDGCTVYCIPETDYICYKGLLKNGQNTTLYCAYTHAIEFAVVSIEKVEYSNKISIVISIKQYLETFWKTKSALKYCFVQSPFPYRNMEVSLLNLKNVNAKLLSPIINDYPQGSLILITFEYLVPIQGQTINLSFNFSQSTDLALVQIPTYNVPLTINPQNNLAAHYYSQGTYKYQKHLTNFFWFLSIVGLLLFMISLVIGGKRIIVEMLMIFQVSFVSLITVPLVTPMFSAIRTLSVVNNGYNILAGSSMRPVEDLLSDERIKGMLLYSQFLYNLNTGILVIFIPIIVGIVVFIISKTGEYSEHDLKKIQNAYRYALGQYVFIGLIFISCILGASTVIEIKFGMKEISPTISLLSLVIPGVLLILYPFYLVIRGYCPQFFDEYQTIVNDDSFSRLFQMIYCLIGLILGALLSYFCRFQLINVIAAAIPFTFFLITVCKSTFKKQFDHYRTQLNLLTLTFIQIPFFYTNFDQKLQYSSQSDLNLMMPLLLAVLLFLNFITNLFFFVYLVFKKCWEASLQRQKRQKSKTIEEESVRQQIGGLYKNSLINPLSCLNKSKFIDGFIEYSEKDPEEIELKELPKRNFEKHKSFDSQKNIPQKIAILQEDYIHNKFNQIDQL